MGQLRVKISAAMANEWDSRAITDVIPDLPAYEYSGCVLTVPVSVAREILADCEFNGDAKRGPEEMPGGTRRAYRAMAKQLREALRNIDDGARGNNGSQPHRSANDHPRRSVRTGVG